MALFRRIKQSDIKFFSNQYLRFYFQTHSPCRAEYSCTKLLALNYRSLLDQKSQFELPSNCRFFAAPVQAKPKKEEKETGPRLNDEIKEAFIRLVTEEGHCIIPKQEALKRARNLQLDLVEVQRHAKPPVCKIMDYHKEKYQQELKEKDRAKNKFETTLRKGACKEIRFSGNITQRDLQIKVDMVKRLMERGYRVKAKGNKDKGGEGEDSATLLSRICALIEDFSVIESDTRVEDKDQAHIIVRHIKYGPLKKGSVKKGSSTNKFVSGSGQSDNDESEDKADEDFEKEESGWKLDTSNEEFENVFELDSPDVGLNLGNAKQSSPSSAISSRYATNPFLRHGSANGASTSSTSVAAGTENRDMNDPRNTYPGRIPLNAGGYGERNSSQFYGSGHRPQLNVNSSPIGRQAAHNGNQSSTFQNRNHPSSPSPSYGIFSGDNAPADQSSPAESNRYKQRNPSGGQLPLQGFRR